MASVCPEQPSQSCDTLFDDPETRIFLNPFAVSVRAQPMALRDYLQLRGWGSTGVVDMDAEGYMVERPEMGPPHQRDLAHFVAWLPRENFEQFYEKLEKTAH